MKYLIWLWLVPAASMILLCAGGCGRGSSGDGGSGGSFGFCDMDTDCPLDNPGETTECGVYTCDSGFCNFMATSEGAPCGADAVCRSGLCLPTELKAFVKASNPEPDARFGYGAVIDGDRMLVGGPSITPGAGTVTLYERDGEEWSIVQEFEHPTVGVGGFDGLFGWSVALGSDFFVVGSLGLNLVGSGSARIFRLLPSVGEWREYDRLVGSPQVGQFAVSLDVSGDYLVVGAPGETGLFSGAAYVYEEESGIWTAAALLEASNSGSSYECVCEEGSSCVTQGAGDAFGSSVAISGDTLVVGAPAEASSATGVNGDETDNSAPEAGAAYVFERLDGIWTQTHYLKASNSGAGDRFGFAVTIDGDVIVVGAEREDSVATGQDGDEANDAAEDAGATYVFERVAGDWEQTAYLKPSNTVAGYFFGANLALSDGTLVVGAPGEAEDSGAAYVFRREGDSWVESRVFKAFNARPGASFAGPIGSINFARGIGLCNFQATSSASSVDVSGNTVAVGAPFEDSGVRGINGVQTGQTITDSGAVYVFENDAP